MSKLAKLFIDDKEYPLLNCEFSFNQPINSYNNKPSGKVKMGAVYVRLVMDKGDAITRWMQHPAMQKDGEIAFYPANGLSAPIRLKFGNAYCTNIKGHFVAHSNQPTSTTLQISPGIMDINGVISETNWNPSNPFTEQTPIAVKEETQEELLITGVSGPKEIKYDEEVAYKVTSFNLKNISESDKKRIKWVAKIDGKLTKLEDKGILLKYKTTDKEQFGKEIIIMPYLKKPTENVSVKVKIKKPTDKFEVILIAGTEQHSATYGNKLMFPAQAVREINKNYSSQEYISFLLFTDGYNTKQLKQIESSAKKHNKKINFIKLKTVSQLIDYLNKGDESFNRLTPNSKYHLVKVGTIKIFSHGLPSILDFGLDGKREIAQRFSISDVIKLDPKVFKNSTIYSYACRTGNSDSSIAHSASFISYGDDWEDKVKPEESLAQKLADHLGINVYAFLRRTNYQPTWNDKGDEKFQKGYDEIDDESVNGNILKFWDWDETLWHNNGAYSLPRSGDTPKGLPSEMYLFRKGEKPKPN